MRGCFVGTAIGIVAIMAAISLMPPTMVAAAPTVSIETDGESYVAGDTIEVSLSGENYSGGMSVAVYVGLLTPDGGLYTFHEGAWFEDVDPWIDEIYVPDPFSMEPTAFWWFSIPSSMPPIGDVGGYNFAAGLTYPGTFEFVSDISFAMFRVTGEPGIPNAVIEDIAPNPATQGIDVVEFFGRGEDEGAIVAYEWRSSIDGQLSTQEDFTCAAYDLSVGTHIIFFRVCDDDGNWSEEDSRELTIQSQGATATVEGRACEAGTETVIAGAQVNIGQISDTTGPDGLYSLEGVPLGEHTINAEFPGFEPYEAAISVVQGSNIHHIYMTPSTQTTNLRGTVTDYADLSVAGARVDIAGETAYTDSSGHYEFLGLAQGAYNLRVSEVACYDDYSAEIELNTAEMTHDVRLSLSALPAPSGFTASANGFLLNSLSWNPVECAVRYNVYLSTNGGGSSQLLDQVSPPDTGYQHSLNSNCSDLWYSVAPVGLDGREAQATQWVAVTPVRRLDVESDFTVSGDLCFDQSIIIGQAVVLTVTAGSRLRFAESCGIEVYGGLLAQGTGSSGIVFEGSGGTGTWGHVAFHDTSDDNSCKLSYVKIQGGMETHGGAIYCDGASPTIEYCTIRENTAAQGGGGITCLNYSSPTIEGNTISGNSAIVGGAICCHESSPSIQDNTITGNSAGNDGGGIFYYKSSPSIQNNTITGNSAGHGGGICCFSDSLATITGNSIRDNVAIFGGGIACEDYSSPRIQGNTITGNSADYGGGTYCYAYCAPTIESNTISGNTATVHGAGIYYSYSWPTIRGNTISSNQADSCGGGIYCYEDAPGNSPIIFNNLITGNLAIVYGGAISTYNSEPRINNNTIAGNTGQAAAGGIYSVNWPEPSIFDCILWDNVGDDLYGCSDVTYSCVEDGHSGAGNIQDNPLFDGPYGCYYLAPTSPCVNAGSQSAQNAGLSQRTTQTDGAPDTGTVDMGYHYPIPAER